MSVDNITPEQWDSMTAKWAGNHSQKANDPVNNPSHYNTGGIECIDAMQAMLSTEEFIGYLRGNGLKYRWRFRYKNGIEDLRKAEWYENRLLSFIVENDINIAGDNR
jgi:hypothetical protein